MNKIDFSTFPKLASEKFTLRQLSQDDVAQILAIRSDPEVAKYLDRPIYKSIDEAAKFIEKINKGIKNNEWIYWVINYKDDKRLIGTICLWNLSDDKTKADIGFELLPSEQGKGIMQEVVPIILNYGFNEMGLKVIEGEVEQSNIKSIKLMEKYGFVLREKEKSQENSQIIVYYLTDDKWKTR